MLRAAVKGAATAARAGVAMPSAWLPQQHAGAGAVLTRHFATPSRFSPDRVMSKKEIEACYERIAAKLDKTTNGVSTEAIDRTLTFLQQVGLTKSLALSAVAMHPMMAGYLIPTMEDKVSWLCANGLTGPLLVRAIARHPNILGVREQALLDVKEWYISNGVHPSKLPFLISVFPHAVSMSIRENLEPKRQFLVKQGLSQRQVVGVLQRCPQFMSLSLDCLESKVVYLKQRALTVDAITKLIACSPEVLGLSTASMDAKLQALDELLGGPEVTAEVWSARPRIIMCKSKQLTRAYTYLVTVVGMTHERIMRNIGLLMRNIDRITHPRYEFLHKEEFSDRLKLAENVSWITISDSVFQERFPAYKGGSSSSASKTRKTQAARAF